MLPSASAASCSACSARRSITSLSPPATASRRSTRFSTRRSICATAQRRANDARLLIAWPHQCTSSASSPWRSSAVAQHSISTYAYAAGWRSVALPSDASAAVAIVSRSRSSEGCAARGGGAPHPARRLSGTAAAAARGGLRTRALCCSRERPASNCFVRCPRSWLCESNLRRFASIGASAAIARFAITARTAVLNLVSGET